MSAYRKTQLQGRIERYLQLLAAEPPAGYVTYAIKEPVASARHADDGIPFYVGETTNLARRARQHLRRGGSPTHDRHSVYWHIYRLLAAERLPRFVILERTASRAASLQSEAQWAQRFLEQGHVLANQWTEHKAGKARATVPGKRLWSFTLAEAAADGLTLRVECRRCKTSLPLPLASVMAAAPPATRLGALRLAVGCPACDFVPCLRVAAG